MPGSERAATGRVGVTSIYWASVDCVHEQVRFYHHQLQDYFSAQALRRRFQANEDLSTRWRQPTLTREMPDPGPLRDDEPLPPPPASGWDPPIALFGSTAGDE